MKVLSVSMSEDSVPEVRKLKVSFFSQVCVAKGISGMSGSFVFLCRLVLIPPNSFLD